MHVKAKVFLTLTCLHTHRAFVEGSAGVQAAQHQRGLLRLADNDHLGQLVLMILDEE